MPSNLPDAVRALLRELVTGYHVLDHDGQTSGVAGHLSARTPGARTFWSHRFGLTFGEIGADELLEADFELNVVSGNPPINPTMHIHTRIYLARPDVNVIVHTHGRSVLALSAIGAELEMCTQPAALFYNDIAYLDEYEGAALGKSEGETIAAALGAKSAIILRNHGQLIVGSSVGEAVFRAVRLESVAGLQLTAMASGKLQRMPEAATRQVQQFQNSGVTQLQWEALKREVLRRRPHILEGLRDSG
ncbi:MAG: aldolase [Betaproteobacteria bacterium]|nr:aldolase [Betaproteobacteria bacterium]